MAIHKDKNGRNRDKCHHWNRLINGTWGIINFCQGSSLIFVRQKKNVIIYKEMRLIIRLKYDFDVDLSIEKQSKGQGNNICFLSVSLNSFCPTRVAATMCYS